MTARRGWVVVVFVCAVAAASSRPGSALESDLGISIPSHWRSLPELAGTGHTAGQPALARKGWGDPVTGCFLLTQAATAPADTDPGAIHQSFAAALAASTDPALEVFELRVEFPDPRRSDSRLSFRAPALSGMARTLVVADGAGYRARSAACFYNPREPEISRSLCDQLLESLSP